MGLDSAEFSEMREVQFFHRTVRDFVLGNSKLEEVTGQQPSLNHAETYHRLWLAEMILAGPSYRRAYWNRVHLSALDRFQQKLPLELLKGLSHVFDDGQDNLTDDTMNGIFLGCQESVNTLANTGNRLSFVHLAARNGQQEYVLEEITKHPGLANGSGKFHLLMSALAGGEEDLIRALLQTGSSPMDPITCEWYEEQAPRSGSIPIWIAVTGYIVGYYIYYLERKNRFEILELILQGDGIDSRNCLFLFNEKNDGPPTHYITLRQFIEIFSRRTWSACSLCSIGES